MWTILYFYSIMLRCARWRFDCLNLSQFTCFQYNFRNSNLDFFAVFIMQIHFRWWDACHHNITWNDTCWWVIWFVHFWILQNWRAVIRIDHCRRRAHRLPHWCAFRPLVIRGPLGRLFFLRTFQELIYVNSLKLFLWKWSSWWFLAFRAIGNYWNKVALFFVQNWGLLIFSGWKFEQRWFISYSSSLLHFLTLRVRNFKKLIRLKYGADFWFFVMIFWYFICTRNFDLSLRFLILYNFEIDSYKLVKFLFRDFIDVVQRYLKTKIFKNTSDSFLFIFLFEHFDTWQKALAFLFILVLVFNLCNHKLVDLLYL